MSEEAVTREEFASALAGPRLFGLHGQMGECVGLPHGKVREGLTVQTHAGGLEARDELAIAQPMLPGRCVDPDHPQTPEITLLAPPANKGVGE